MDRKLDQETPANTAAPGQGNQQQQDPAAEAGPADVQTSDQEAQASAVTGDGDKAAKPAFGFTFGGAPSPGPSSTFQGFAGSETRFAAEAQKIGDAFNLSYFAPSLSVSSPDKDRADKDALDIARLTDELKDCREKLRDREHQLDEEADRLVTQEATIHELRKEVESLKKSLNDAKAQHDEAASALDKSAAQVEDLQQSRREYEQTQDAELKAQKEQAAQEYAAAQSDWDVRIAKLEEEKTVLKNNSTTENRRYIELESENLAFQQRVLSLEQERTDASERFEALNEQLDRSISEVLEAQRSSSDDLATAVNEKEEKDEQLHRAQDQLQDLRLRLEQANEQAKKDRESKKGLQEDCKAHATAADRAKEAIGQLQKEVSDLREKRSEHINGDEKLQIQERQRLNILKIEVGNKGKEINELTTAKKELEEQQDKITAEAKATKKDLEQQKDEITAQAKASREHLEHVINKMAARLEKEEVAERDITSTGTQTAMPLNTDAPAALGQLASAQTGIPGSQNAVSGTVARTISLKEGSHKGLTTSTSRLLWLAAILLIIWWLFASVPYAIPAIFGTGSGSMRPISIGGTGTRYGFERDLGYVDIGPWLWHLMGDGLGLIGGMG